jgi:small subunit ribosomal protein S20
VAHSLSAKKRVRQNIRRHSINRARKSRIKTQIKKLELALTGGDAAAAKEQFLQMVKNLDKIASTSSMHKKTAARKKSRMAKRLKKLAAAKQG